MTAKKRPCNYCGRRMKTVPASKENEMILYFSATGNCKYVAKRIAGAIGDTACSIEGLSAEVTLREGEILGLVTPTYAWELPLIVREYLENMQISGNANPYTFVVATYGTMPGAACADAAHILKKKGIKVSARFCVKMPDTWTPWFDLSDPAKVHERNEKAEGEINSVITAITARKTGNRMRLFAPYPVRFFTDSWYRSQRKTKNFFVEDSCIGCNLCAAQCPASAIRLENGKPVWQKEQCYLCLRCLHSCPKFAIQFGDGQTRKHGQYINPNAKE